MKSLNKAIAGYGGELTAHPFAVPEANNTDNSYWLYLPKPKQRLWGLSRKTWRELLDSGKVKSITLSKGKGRYGIKLISRSSAEAYLKTQIQIFR